MNDEDFGRIVRNQNRQISRRLRGGIRTVVAAFGGAARTIASGTIDLKKALNALAATHKALAELARRATGKERIRYKDLMDAVLVELKAVAQEILNNQGKLYEPITVLLRRSAADLGRAYKYAEKTIKDMNNATEILNGFATLVKAFG